jgi:osmoprotectant transport system ATP-binding protein
MHASPNMSAALPFVRFDNVSYAPQGAAVAIISELNLEIFRGETLVLLGESGCGKTTTLRLVNRMLLPTSGKVWVGGKPTGEWDAIALRRSTGYVIQEAGLFPHFTVERNVALVPALEGWAGGRVRERVREMLALVGLDPETYGARFPRELSGGQRQRVGVARALAADPPLLLMDEPFGALDPLTRTSLQNEFARLRTRLDKTVILVTHDVREALRLATRIALMRAGRIVLLATPEEFMRTEEPLARAYLETLRLDENSTAPAAKYDD